MSRSPLLPSLCSVALLALGACNQISKAPQNVPRVEMEVAVRLDDAFGARLGNLDAEFQRELQDMILAKADAGLRFYPVLTERYSGEGPRPPYLMTVGVRDLEYELDYRTVQQAQADPVVESWVKRVTTGVAVQVVKRRESGPELTVANAIQTGSTMVDRPRGEGTGPMHPLRREENQQALAVPRAALLRAIDAAVTKALKEMLPAIDRDLTSGK